MTSAINSVVVDIQCFRTNEDNNKIELTPKELAVYDGKEAYYYLFKEPFPFDALTPALKRKAILNIKYHHGIPWTEGSTPVEDFALILHSTTHHANVIHVKGLQKAELLRKYISKPVVEFPDHPGLKPTNPSCCYHIINRSACALSNVYTLYDFFLRK